MGSLTVAATAISSSVGLSSGFIPAWKAVTATIGRSNNGALRMLNDPRAQEIGAAVRSRVGLGYAPVSAAEYAMMDAREQQQPVVGVREHPAPEDMNMFAYPTEESPQPQRQQQPLPLMNNNDSARRYFKEDRRQYNEVLPGVFSQHEGASDLAFPLSETISSSPTQYEHQTQEGVQGIPNRDIAEALHSASSIPEPRQQYQYQQPQYQQQYQQPQPRYQPQYQIDTPMGLGLVSELEYSYRYWGVVLPDAEKDDLALFILPNTLYCSKSLSIYYDRVLLFGGWEEILPDDLDSSSQNIRSRESLPFLGYDLEKRRKTTPTTDENEPSIVEMGPGAFL